MKTRTEKQNTEEKFSKPTKTKKNIFILKDIDTAHMKTGIKSTAGLKHEIIIGSTAQASTMY